MNIYLQHTVSRLAVFVIALAAVTLASTSPAEARKSEIELRSMNGVYENLKTQPEPIRQGPLTVYVSSPEHRLTIHGNHLHLKRNDDGTVAAKIDVDFEGSGHLIAKVEGFGRFNDDVTAHRQTVQAAGTVRIERQKDGFLFTIVETESKVSIEIESGVARQVVGACRTAAKIPLLRLPCDGIDAALASISVPMPEPGKQFLLSSDEMTRKEKAFFNRFVGD